VPGESTRDSLSNAGAPGKWQRGNSSVKSVGIYCASRIKKGIRVDVELSAVLNKPQTLTLEAESDLLGKGSSPEFELPAAPGRITVSVLFKNPRISEVGLGWWEEEICWRSKGQFAHETTSHQLYRTLDLPTTPWAASPGSRPEAFRFTPNLLKTACTWAWGARNVEDAAALIATHISTLGTMEVLKYDGSNRYVSYSPGDSKKVAILDLATFVSDIETKRAITLNCFDCSYITVSLANLLGAQLKCMSLMVPQPAERFDLGLVRLLGTNELGVPVAPNINTFSVHIVAWSGPSSSEGKVYDGLVRFPDRSGSSLRWFTPVGMPFKQYRSLLVSPKWAPFLTPTLDEANHFKVKMD
jgi:hypothetical protein